MNNRQKIRHVHGALIASILCACLAVVQSAYTEAMGHSESHSQTAYSLVGPWQFRPGDDMNWASPRYDDSGWENRHIPELWPLGGYPESNQFAWYRHTHTLDIPTGDKRIDPANLGVRMGKIMSAYELYAGGKLIGAVGSLPPQSETNHDRIGVYAIPASAIADDGTLVLALRVWGGTELATAKWGGGPYERNFSVGEYARLLQRNSLGEIPGLMASVLFLGFGFYHLYLYWRNRQLQSWLWYGLTALLVGTYGLMVNQWRYALGWSFLTYEKIEFGSIMLVSAVAIQMMWSLLQLPIGRTLRGYQLSFVALAIAVVLIPGLDIHYQILRPFQLWSVALLVLFPWVFIREARAGNAEARTGLIGVLIFIAACTNDLLIDFAGWQGVRQVPVGFMAIMLFMIVSLANRFTTVFNNLESEVAQRTEALNVANQQLADAARLDPLTGLLNRRGFSEEAEVEVEVQRFGNPPIFSCAQK